MTTRLLIVDDSQDSLSLLTRMLVRHLPDCDVQIATSGAEGISVAQNNPIDVILLDAKMPNMDGFETCHRLKADPATAMIPVLMVSGVMLDARDRVAGLETGADGYLCKPFEPEELIAQVKALLRARRAEDALRNREKDLEKELATRTRNLVDSEQRFRALFERSPDPVFVEDMFQGIVMDVNPAACAMHGMTREELIGKSVLDLVPENEHDRVKRNFSRWFSGELKSVEGSSLRSDGRTVRVELRANRVTFNGKQAIIIQARDVTSRHDAERALQVSEARYRALLEDQTDLICRVRPNGTLLFANTAYCEFTGRAERDLIGISFLPLLPEGERARVAAHLRGLTVAEPVQRIEHLAIGADGRTRWQQWINRGIFDEHGALTEIQSSGRDITDQKVAEEHRISSALWLRAVVEMADELIVCPDLDTLYRKAVELARSRLGLERCGILLLRDEAVWGSYGTDMQGRTTDERRHRTSMDDGWRERLRLKKGDESRSTISEEEYREWVGGEMRACGGKGPVAATPIQTASRSIGLFFNDNAISGTPLDTSKQEIVAVFCSLMGNIAERKASEAERNKLAAAVEQAAETIIITDLEGIIQYVNPGFSRMTGYTREEAIGKNPRFLKSDRHDTSFFDHLWKTIIRGDVWTGRITNKKKDGTLLETEQTISPIRDAAGQIVNFLAVTQDVTRSILMESELRQSQKMESVGRLAGGIAHDFNNLLTAILGFARLTQAAVGEQHAAAADVQEIINAAERAAALTKQLLAFGRKQILKMRPLDLNAVVLNMDHILRRTLGEDIELVTICSENISSVEADAGLIEQVIINLAVNARDAMEKGGKLAISTGRTTVDDAYAFAHPGVSPGEYILLTVHDTGHGMTDHVREHAFEPFFTTKEKGKGTGLGLSTVYGIVKQCRGHIDLQSAPGRGTEFNILFPLAKAVPQKVVPAPASPAPRGSETILVVEDEQNVRQLVVRNLSSLGYRVLESPNGEDALRIYRSNAEPIHLVLTDVVMPRMGGPELAEQLWGHDPNVKVLYMSGFTDDTTLDRVRVKRAADLILKPFTIDALGHAIRQALDAA